jgi:hypothetical protein
MSYLLPEFLRTFNIRNFILYFCVTYTFLDITGAIVSALNHTGGGLVHNDTIETIPGNLTNNTLNLLITVKSNK